MYLFASRRIKIWPLQKQNKSNKQNRKTNKQIKNLQLTFLCSSSAINSKSFPCLLQNLSFLHSSFLNDNQIFNLTHQSRFAYTTGECSAKGTWLAEALRKPSKGFEELNGALKSLKMAVRSLNLVRELMSNVVYSQIGLCCCNECITQHCGQQDKQLPLTSTCFSQMITQISVLPALISRAEGPK